MNQDEKLQIIQPLLEKDLTRDYIIPLLESRGMGCKSIRFTHHNSLEFGRDIIYERINEYGRTMFTGVQVKRGEVDVDGLIRQTLEAFGEKFNDSRDHGKKDIDRFVILSSGNISEAKKESISAAIRGCRLDKMVTIIDGKELIALLDKYLPWPTETKEESYLTTVVAFENIETLLHDHSIKDNLPNKENFIRSLTFPLERASSALIYEMKAKYRSSGLIGDSNIQIEDIESNIESNKRKAIIGATNMADGKYNYWLSNNMYIQGIESIKTIAKDAMEEMEKKIMIAEEK